jgi:acetyltransferase-like isoleucine patch superfamily enzyme
VRIGDNVSIAAHCFIIDSNHGIRKDALIRDQPMESERIIIGDDVWIAAHCAVIKGARIRDGAVIGAGAVVNSEIPEYSIAVGVPARVIGRRS